jgi:tetratricopeptide (TPR) repeat protein/predicted Ser/Thr protein kinase
VNERDLFMAALQIEDHAARCAFLDQASSGQAGLRERVEALLEAFEQAGSFLQRPPHEVTPPPAAGLLVDTDGAVPQTRMPSTIHHPELPAAEAESVRIAGYEVLGRLGKGGMGVVYQARQTALRRIVALKMILHADHAGDDERRRFQAEAETIARLQHPNIVQIYEVGQHDGVPYFSLEFCSGGSLEKQLDGTPWEPKRAAELVEVLARAMQVAHQAEIIHRDLKPANVLLTADGTPKITDFGLVKRLDMPGQTQGGALVGTPSYMPPEQTGAGGGPVGPAADVYALGAILYELLSGRPPFKATTVMDTVLQVLREEPVPVRRLQPKTPRDIETICHKCLEKEPRKRYPSAAALAEDLRRFQDGEPVRARPVGPVGRLVKWARRKPAVAGLLALVLLVLAGGIVGTTTGMVRALRERDQKDEALRQTRQALNTMTDEVVADLQGAQVQLTERNRQFLNKVLDYHAAFAAARADDVEGRHSRADGFFRVGEIRLYLGELPEAETAFREAIALQKELAGDFPARLDFRRELGWSYHHLGMLLWTVDRGKEAAEAQGESIALARQLVAESGLPQYRADLANSESSLGTYSFKELRFEEAEKHFREALAIEQQLVHEFPDVADYHHDLFHTYYHLGFLLSHSGRPEEAEKVCKEAEALHQRLIPRFRTRPEFREDLGDTYMLLAVLLQSTRRPVEAEKAWRQAKSIFKEISAEFPARPYFRLKLGAADNNLGMLLVRSKRLKEAEEVWGETLALYKQLSTEIETRADFRLQVALGYHNLAALLHMVHRLKEAEESWHKAVEIARDLVQKHPKQTAYLDVLVMSSGHLALLLCDTDRVPEGEKAWREVLELCRDVTHDLALSETYGNLGEAQEDMPGRREQTIAAYREAIRLNSANANAHYRLGNVLKANGQPEKAITEYREAIRLDKDFPQAHVNLGNILMDRKELEEAIAEFHAAIRTKDEFPEAYKAHHGLGNALMAKGQPKEAIAEYRTAIRLNKNFALAHYNLGNALFPKQLEEAISEYRTTIRLNKNYAEAHTNLGNSLARQGDLDEAIREYRTAIGINKDLFEAHVNLGFALTLIDQVDDAITECREAIRVQNHPRAHDRLGLALQAKGRLHDAVDEYREAIRLDNHNDEAGEHLHEAERLIQLQKRLPAMVQGKDSSKDASELLAFAQLCRWPFGEQYAASTRFSAAAFAAEPKLAAEFPTPHRYDAACAAALAGCGKGKDTDKLDDNERARLRRQALNWLRAELDGWGRVFDNEPDKARPILIRELRHWLKDPDFAGVRGAEALGNLPETERQAWQKLWTDVATLLKRAQEKTAPEKRGIP